VLLRAAVVVSAGGEAVGRVRAAWACARRARSPVEGVNSVLRRPQARPRRLTQGLWDLQRVDWNCRALRTGRRRQRTPSQLLGARLPTDDWGELLKGAPEQLRQQLSAPPLAA
jgi:hypothetical protein